MSGILGPCECPLGRPHAVTCPNYVDLSDYPPATPAMTHECVFPEEQEPGGRLILAPCLTCGLTALDALAQRNAELELAHTTGDQMARELVQAWKLLGLDEPDADDYLPTKLAEVLRDLRGRVAPEVEIVATHAALVAALRRADRANEALVYYDRVDRPWISWLDSKRQRWAVSYPVKGNHYLYSDPFTLATKVDASSDFIRLPIRIVDAHVKATGDRPERTA